MKYMKKPVVIEAVQWTGDNESEIKEFMAKAYVRAWGQESEKPLLKICTLEGTMYASVNDFIIRGVQGELYPCKPEIFELTYEKVTNEQ